MTSLVPIAIQMDRVDSSQIHSIGHDAGSSTLAIRFKNKDGAPTSLYHYRNVSADDFAAFRDAESIGSHFYKHIKPFADKYPYVKVESAPVA
ncbi:KTSC domain-containing protein [Cupriavidus gilardii]|uniref:KTSC domain-containing protein n=1 Tax=Cupriavidus gilardii TaxID=82541 RepID=A0ABY4VP61_9BURK|nr:KTSC domain-containing protein [Cupriavidus gilardii]USE79021.1 KTSC domain-containing protein [Cupriavidus gilardii]